MDHEIWRFVHSFRGRLHQELAKQHKKYGEYFAHLVGQRLVNTT